MINNLLNDLEDEIGRELLGRARGSKLRQGRNGKKDLKNEFIKSLSVETWTKGTEITFICAQALG